MSVPHFWISALILWLVFLSNLGRFFEVEFVSWQTALLAVAASVVSLLVICHQKVKPFWTIGGSLALYLVLKLVNVNSLTIEYYDRVALESLVVLISAWLSTRSATGIVQMEETVAHLAGLKLPISFHEVQPEFYQEVRRARRYGRPVSLLAIQPTTKLKEQLVQDLKEDLLEKLADEYADAHFAELIHSQLGDCDLLAKSEDNFLILLPESDRESAYRVASQLAQHFKQLGPGNLMVGISEFPKGEITLAGLVKAAESQLKLISPAAANSMRADPAHALVAEGEARELIHQN